MLRALLNWISGWRRCKDGWLVRARRETDPDLCALNRSDLGFTEDACIAVRTHRIARVIDHGFVPSNLQWDR